MSAVEVKPFAEGTDAELEERVRDWIPQTQWDCYRQLSNRSRAVGLSDAEREELFGLIDAVEMANVHRLEALYELARRRGTTFEGIKQALGVRMPDPDA